MYLGLCPNNWKFMMDSKQVYFFFFFLLHLGPHEESEFEERKAWESRCPYSGVQDLANSEIIRLNDEHGPLCWGSGLQDSLSGGCDSGLLRESTRAASLKTWPGLEEVLSTGRTCLAVGTRSQFCTTWNSSLQPLTMLIWGDMWLSPEWTFPQRDS